MKFCEKTTSAKEKFMSKNANYLLFEIKSSQKFWIAVIIKRHLTVHETKKMCILYLHSESVI